MLKVNDFPTSGDGWVKRARPRWVVAYKWEKYEGTTQVEDIAVHVGKTGQITPVAHLETGPDRRVDHLPRARPSQRR